MGTPLKLLLIEDSVNDADLIVSRLTRAGYDVSHQRIEDGAQMWQALQKQTWDVIIADHSLPQFDSLQALQVLKDSGLDIPFIIMSGIIGEDVAVRAMKSGAHDYVPKNSPARLAAVVEREVAEAKVRAARKQAEEALKQNETQFRDLFENAPLGYVVVAPDGLIQMVNRRLAEMLQYTPAELAGRHISTLHPPLSDAVEKMAAALHAKIISDQSLTTEDRMLRKDGSNVWVELVIRPVFDSAGKAISSRTAVLDITERKKVEDKIVHLASFPELNPASISEFHLDGSVSYSNPATKRLFPDLESLGTSHPYLAQWQNTVSQVTDEKTDPLVREVKVGDRCYLQTLQYIAALKTIRIYGIDITKRKQAEEMLRLSENRFKQISEDADEWIWEVDTEGMYFYCSPAVGRILGYEPDDLVGKKHFYDLFTPDVRERLKEAAFAAFKKKQSIKKLINSNSHRNGKTVFLETTASPIIDNNGNLLGYRGVDIDITERKQAEEILQESEERHRIILHTAMDGFWLADSQGRLLEVNETYCRMSGYGKQELLAMRISDLEYSETSDDVAIRIKKIIAKGEDRFETHHRRKDGTIMDVEVSVQYQTTNGGRLVVFIQDITQRKRAEVENQILRDKAEMSSRLTAVGEMAAGIAHEINNPLTGVIGFSELLLERKGLPADIREELKIISDGSQRVKEIVKRMLTFARQTKPVKTRVDVHELIENTLEIRGYVLKTTNIEVIRDYDPELPWITADPGQLQQVFLNLIVNAEYAMKKAHGKGKLTITTRKTDGHILLTFKDDGPGMTEAVRAKLFQPFFTTKDPGEGTGLGLSLSRSIILEHGGEIRVESRPGEGAAFIIELPLTVEEPGVPAPEVATVARAMPDKKAHILVVDDETTITKLLSQVLKKAGHSVDTLGSPQEALEKLGKESYDLLLLDVRLPGTSGMELYERILKTTPRLGGRIIFMTGDINDAGLLRYLEQTKAPHIAKPFNTDDLLVQIQSLLAPKNP